MSGGHGDRYARRHDVDQSGHPVRLAHLYGPGDRWNVVRHQCGCRRILECQTSKSLYFVHGHRLSAGWWNRRTVRLQSDWRLWLAQRLLLRGDGHSHSFAAGFLLRSGIGAMADAYPAGSSTGSCEYITETAWTSNRKSI